MARIDEGSYGEVFIWIEKSTNQPFAVKKMIKSRLMAMNKVYHVEREHLALRMLSETDNVVKFKECFQDKEHIYMIMQLIPNGQLLYLMKHQIVMDRDLVLYIFANVVKTVADMHALGIAHRDIKPTNICISESFRPVLIDFGTAKFNQIRKSNEERNELYLYETYRNYIMPDFLETEKNLKLKNSGSFVGTEEYLPPEIVNRETSGPESDVWSLGILLYQMLSKGQMTPFKAKGGNQADTFAKIKEGQIFFDEHFPEQARDLITKMLRVDFHERIDLRKVMAHGYFRGINFN